MTAYSFKPQFEMPIKLGLKRGTIRANGRRRHAMPGEALQLYTGMRTKNCRLLARAMCSANDWIRLDFYNDTIDVIKSDSGRQIFLRQKRDLYDFALSDGFADFEEMARFWLKTHGDDCFEGRWIQWNPESLLVVA